MKIPVMSAIEAIPRKQQKNYASRKSIGLNNGSGKRSRVVSMEVHKKNHFGLCTKLSLRTSINHNRNQYFKWNVDGIKKTRRTDSDRGSMSGKP